MILRSEDAVVNHHNTHLKNQDSPPISCTSLQLKQFRNGRLTKFVRVRSEIVKFLIEQEITKSL